MSTPKLYRPTLQKQPKTAKGYVAYMTDSPSHLDNDWNGRESRQWVKLTDYTAAIATKDAEIASLREANRYLIDMHDAVIDDARKYTAAQAEIARLREAFTPLADALLRLLDATEGFAVDAYAKATARTALARAGVEL